MCQKLCSDCPEDPRSRLRLYCYQVGCWRTVPCAKEYKLQSRQSWELQSMPAIRSIGSVLYHRHREIQMALNPEEIQAEDALIDELRDIVGEKNVLSERDELLVYE